LRRDDEGAGTGSPLAGARPAPDAPTDASTSASTNLSRDDLRRLTFDAAPDGILVADDDGRYLDANPAATRMLGYTRAELLGMSVSDVVVADRGWTDTTWSAFRMSGDWRGELDLRCKDGTLLTVESHAARIEAGGRGAHVAVLRDVSARVSDQRAQADLLASERSARRAAEQAWERLALVSEISELLAEWTDYPQALTRLAQVLTRGFADVCAIDLVDENGRLVRAAAVHADPRRQELVDRLRAAIPLQHERHPAVSAIRTGRPVHAAEIDEEILYGGHWTDEHRTLIRALGYESFISVPLIARQHVIGAISLVSTTPQRRYGADDVPAVEEIARRVAVRLDNARLYAERDEIASALQAALLPARLPAVRGLDLAARYEAAGRGQVGGDFYDVFELPDASLLVVIGDVLGKGSAAAAVTGLARHTIRAVSIREPRPAAILRALNDVLMADDAFTRFVTACCMRLDPATGTGELCVAGHPPPLVLDAAGAAAVACPPGLILGEFANPDLVSVPLALGPDESVLLYTDGLLGGEADVDALVDRLAAQGEACASAAELADRALRVAATGPQADRRVDDVAIVVVRRSSGDPTG
jgi:PAS domain S-box-containing protein